MSETITTTATQAPSTSGSGAQAQGSAAAPTQSSPGSSTPTQSSGNGMAQGQAAATEAQAGQANSEQTPPAKRYLDADADQALVKVKIDGQEQELTVAELKRLNSLEKASQKRMQESAKVQKQFQAMLEQLQKDPWEVLKARGMDPDALAEERLARKYELSQMSPEQRENLELKARIEAQERLEMESKRSVIDEIKKLSDVSPEHLEKLQKFSKEDLANYRDHLNSVNTQAQQALQQEMISAWEETKLPKHKTWANWMAMEMMGHEKRTGEPLQAKEAAAKVKGDWLKFNKHLFAQMDAQAIQEVLGKEVVQKLIDQRIQGVTDQAAQGFQKQGPATPPVSQDKPMNEIEYRKWWKSL